MNFLDLNRILALRAHVLLVLVAPLSLAHAQAEPSDCITTARQCMSLCNAGGAVFSRLIVQACHSKCLEVQRSCTSATAPSRALPPRPGEQAPSIPTPIPIVEAASVPPYVPPENFDYDGPIRFFPKYATTSDARDGPTPFAGEAREPPNHVLNVGHVTPRRNDSDLVKALEAEYEAIRKAGYSALRCSYGPTVIEKGYTEATFWYRKRPVLSENMVRAASKYKGIDLALERCPASLGDAYALASGRQQAPSSDTALAADAALMQRTGQRFIPTIARAKHFDDRRILHRRVVLPVTDLFWDDPGAGRKAWTRQGILDQTLLSLDDQGQQVLLCQYAHETQWSAASGVPPDVETFSPAAEGGNGAGMGRDVQINRIRFWHHVRPQAISTEFLQKVDAMRPVGPNLVDIAVQDCPALYGGALALVDGSPEALAASRRAEFGPASFSQRSKNSDAHDLALVRKIIASISSMEGNLPRLEPAAFRDEVGERLQPSLLELTGSALAKADGIPVGPEGRKQFDRWDSDFGGPIMNIMRRLYVIAKRKAFRLQSEGASLSDLTKTGSQMESETAEWIKAGRSQLFTRTIYRAMIKTYDAHLAGQPLVDASFMQRVNKDLAAAQAVAVRNSQVEFTGTIPVRAASRQEIVFGTPAEIAAYRFKREIVHAATNAIRDAAQVKQIYATLNAQIVRSRERFWRCHDSNCGDAAMLYAEYSQALGEKDYHYLAAPVLSDSIERSAGSSTAQGPLLKQLTTYLGAGAVDDGIILGCAGQADRFKIFFARELASAGGTFAISSAMAAYVKSSASPAYLEWQQCRDRMEYLLRHR